MQYPSQIDYVRAVQHGESFTSEVLRRAEFARDPVSQVPISITGTTAVVFKAIVDGDEEAIRFFTRAASSRDRYDALREHFTRSGLTDCVAMPQWHDSGIRVNQHI